MAPDVDAYAAETANRALSLKCRGGYTSEPDLSRLSYLYAPDSDVLHNNRQYYDYRQGFANPIADGNGKMVAEATVSGTLPYTFVTMQAFMSNGPPWSSIVSLSRLHFNRLDQNLRPFPALSGGSIVSILTQSNEGWTNLSVANNVKAGDDPTQLRVNLRTIQLTRMGIRSARNTPPRIALSPATDVLHLDVNATPQVATTWDFYGRMEGGAGTLEVDDEGNETRGNTLELTVRYDERFDVGQFIRIDGDTTHSYLIEGISLIGRNKWLRLSVERKPTSSS